MRIFAYLDAGTGSLFVQATIGVFLAGGVMFRGFMKKSYDRLKHSAGRQSSEREDA